MESASCVHRIEDPSKLRTGHQDWLLRQRAAVWAVTQQLPRPGRSPEKLVGYGILLRKSSRLEGHKLPQSTDLGGVPAVPGWHVFQPLECPGNPPSRVLWVFWGRCSADCPRVESRTVTVTGAIPPVRYLPTDQKVTSDTSDTSDTGEGMLPEIRAYRYCPSGQS